MSINILEQPLSLAEIESRRGTLEAERSDVRKKVRLWFAIFILIFLLVVMTGVIRLLSYQFESLAFFTHPGFFVAALSAVSFAIIQTILWVYRSDEVNYKIAQLTFLDFNQGDESKCLKIKKWLIDEDIRTFRDALVEQGRTQFIHAEYYAMQDYWKGRSERLLKQQAEEACKEIFLGGNMQDKA